MTTIHIRIQNICTIIGFTTVILIPVEVLRASIISASVAPILLFAGSEYIIIGNINNTENYAKIIEFGGKDYIENIYNQLNLDKLLGKLY